MPTAAENAPLPFQTPNQVIDVTDWERVEGYGVYPEGSREKSLLRCPFPAPYPFLKPGRKYLLKYSRDRYPAQYWCEILAYRIGQSLDVPVPPVHVAIDGKGRAAALIEWFLEEDNSDSRTSGGDYLQAFYPSFDRIKGRSHSWASISHIFSSNLHHVLPAWRSTWFDMMAFDAMIGNTDRHQENWAVIMKQIPDPGTPVDGSIQTFEYFFSGRNDRQKIRLEFHFAPFFDNGTSLGHELAEEKIQRMADTDLQRYILRGRAHLRWEGEDSHGLRHFELLDRLLAECPEVRSSLRRYEQLAPEGIRRLVMDLCAFDVPHALPPARGDFMARLVTLRRRELLERLHASP